MTAQRYARPDGTELAYDLLPGAAPVVVFLPGYASDMGGTKAMFLRDACAGRGQAMLRLDYSGHGASGGKFEDGSIGIWTEDAARIIEAVTGDKSLILVGSSMGGWIALLLALRFARRVESLLGGNIPVFCPVQILHGMRDDAVPWQHSLTISECLQSEAVRITFVKDGDHRLSRHEDLLLLRASLLRLLGEDAA